jgi:hypothetical protein
VSGESVGLRGSPLLKKGDTGGFAFDFASARIALQSRQTTHGSQLIDEERHQTRGHAA